MAEESWDSIVKQYIKDQPERNAKRLELLRKEQSVGNNVSQEIQHQEQNLDTFGAPKIITEQKTTPPKVDISPRMLEFFGVDSEQAQGDKLNKEMTVPPAPEKPKGWLNDYLNEVVERVSHPLETLGKAAQDFMALPPEEQAMQFVGAGTMIGKASRLWSPMKQEEAIMMEKAGATIQEIKQTLNLHRGAGGAWRSELSDANMKLHLPDPVTLSNGTTIREASLIGVVEHPALYKAYPGLIRNYEFSLVEGTERGGRLYHPIFNDKGVLVKKGLVMVTRPKDIIEGITNPKAVLYGGELDSIKRTVIHEIQHAIQKLEGWQGGANYNAIEKKIRTSPDTYALMKYKQEYSTEEAIQRAAYDEYRKVAGEVEARLAAIRGTMTDKELRELHPFDMGEVPVSEQTTDKKVFFK